MKPEQQCPRCGQTLPPDAPAGHCPKCLVQLAMEAAAAPTVIPASEAVSQTTGAQPLSSAGSRVKYFGDYELVEEIARGGMGVVWKARQASLNRSVALKMILAGRFAGEADVRRFHTEAEAAANLQHPNIVAIHEIGQYEGQHYFSMDYIEGKSLAELVMDGPMPAAQAAALVKRIAEAVHYAHQRGTLHRDLKPSNVLIDAEGQPRITDFGLAKQLSRDTGLTQTGAVLGTPAYMPPEQASGRNEQVGPASDVYSIGAMLYHLLTGHAPFVGETPTATLRKAMEEEPVAPSKLNPQTPPDLETICLKCLEKRPDRRYHSARELGEELGRFLSHEPILARPASAWRKAWSWAQRNPWAIVGVASAIGLALLGLAYGLWEQVQYLRWSSLPPGPEKDMGDRGRGLGSEIPGVIGYLVMWPMAFYARFLNARKQRNLPMNNLQLAILFAGGFLFIALGLWSEMQIIGLHVWTRHFAWYTLVGFGLGLPFLFCWFGGIWVWQAIQTHQAHWSGSIAAEETEWLPRQPLHYHSGAFFAATLLNCVIFLALAYLTTPIWQGDFDRDNRSSAEADLANAAARMVFVGIALAVSFACWIYARRKVNKVPKPVLAFLVVLYGGAAFVCFSIPSARFVLLAALTGLLGGLVLVKAVKIRRVEPAEKLPPLRLGEFLQWDGQTFTTTLTGVVAGLLIPAGLIFLKDGGLVFPFLLFSGMQACLPPVILAVCNTTGKLREFFLVLLVLLGPSVILVPLVVFLDWPVAGPLLASAPIGWAAGCALIYFGKIRPKTR